MSPFTRWSIGAIGRRVALLVGVGSGATIYYERPMPSDPDLVKKQWNIWRNVDLADVADEKDDFLCKVGRHIVAYGTLAVSYLGLEVLSSTTVEKDQRYRYLMGKIRHRSPEDPLLTVSNHGSTIDDPCIMLALLPWDIKLRPVLYRYGLCTEEICFSNGFYSTVFGAGHVMPICRGAGVDQLDLIRFSRRLAAGSWCHIFPEGKTVQTGSIGGSLGRPAGLGKLKWGVGKMVAHCPVPPEIIPVYHTGTQNIVPESPENKATLYDYPRLGETVTIRVGKPIFFQDLITKHEALHVGDSILIPTFWATVGKLRKVHPHRTDGSEQASTAEERMLYSAIALRIQSALEDMEKETRQKLGSAYPERPRIVATGEWKQLVGGKKAQGISVNKKERSSSSYIRWTIVN